MPNALNVGAGKPNVTGSVYTAPEGSVLPTNSKDALDKAYKELGYSNEDGLTNAFEEDSEKIKAWGGDVVLVLPTESSETFALTMIETNEEVAKEFFGAENVSTTEEDLVMISNANEKDVHPWVFEALLSKTRKQRIVVPRGKVIELGEIQYVDGAPVGYPMTIQALPDEQGNRAYRYTAIAAAARISKSAQVTMEVAKGQ